MANYIASIAFVGLNGLTMALITERVALIGAIIFGGICLSALVILLVRLENKVLSNRLSQRLQPGETAVFQCEARWRSRSFSGLLNFRKGFVVVTDRRIFLAAPGFLLTPSIREIWLRDLESVSQATGVDSGCVLISTGGKEILVAPRPSGLFDLPVELGDEMIDVVNQVRAAAI